MGYPLANQPRRRPGAALLRFAVAGLSSLLLVALAGLVVVEVRPGWLSGLRYPGPAPIPPNLAQLHALGPAPGRAASPGPASTSGTARAGGAHHPSGTGRGRPTLAGEPARPVSAPAGRPGSAAPLLAGLQPPAGAPGQILRLTGRNLFSASGQIEVIVAGRPARVRCPSERSCLVTVPPLGGRPRTATLVLHTSGGQSNTVSFTYR